jgi:hypothetical protein
VLAAVWGANFMINPAASEEAKQRQFIGVDKCKVCHKGATKGEQYEKWLAGPHSKAFETLASEPAKAIAKEKGIADPQAAPECLKCHVTGHGVAAEFLGPKHKNEDGVGCESCHGAGSDYYKMATMKSLAAGETEPGTVGLVVPGEKLCVSCHNEESPTFKKFVFAERVKQIAHPRPAKAE